MENDAAYTQARGWARAQLDSGTHPETLVTALVNQGWAEMQARQVLDAAIMAPGALAPTRPSPVMQYATPAQGSRKYSAASSAGSGNHARNMVIGGLICAVGVAITVGTYSSASSSGGTYTVCWGAMIFGFIRFIMGFIGWMTGG